LQVSCQQISIDDYDFIPEYAQQFDRKIEGRKVLLLFDNYPTHRKTIEGLDNIKIFSYPLTQHQRVSLMM
jgi:hypothetical protein